MNLGDVTTSIPQARTLIDTFLRLNPSADDKARVDEKLAKCQGLYEAEGIVNLPLVTHVASSVCYDELIQTLTELIAKYRPIIALPSTSSFPWWGYLAIGGGGLLALGALVMALRPSGTATVVVTKGRKAA
jgi:hypothetical protein